MIRARLRLLTRGRATLRPGPRRPIRRRHRLRLRFVIRSKLVNNHIYIYSSSDQDWFKLGTDLFWHVHVPE